MERGKCSEPPKEMPAGIRLLLSRLESCASREAYAELLGKLALDAKTDKEMEQAQQLIAGPGMKDADPATVARNIRDHFAADKAKEDETPKNSVMAAGTDLVGGLNLSLDTDSLQNIRKELRKTYTENNIGYLANGTSPRSNRKTDRSGHRTGRLGRGCGRSETRTAVQPGLPAHLRGSHRTGMPSQRARVENGHRAQGGQRAPNSQACRSWAGVA